jgi:hypothetical protein
VLGRHDVEVAQRAVLERRLVARQRPPALDLAGLGLDEEERLHVVRLRRIGGLVQHRAGRLAERSNAAARLVTEDQRRAVVRERGRVAGVDVDALGDLEDLRVQQPRVDLRAALPDPHEPSKRGGERSDIGEHRTLSVASPTRAGQRRHRPYTRSTSPATGQGEQDHTIAVPWQPALTVGLAPRIPGLGSGNS